MISLSELWFFSDKKGNRNNSLIDIDYFSVTWEIMEPPIVLGKNVILYCNASVAENCCTNTATWMRDYEVIVHHGSSINSSKYIQIQRSDGFLLVIKRFDEADTDHQYTCLYDFYSHSADLRIDENNFQCLYLS